MEEKTIPHLVIKKVARASQPMMEEYVNRIGGNVERIYYDKRSTSDYPYMFVVFTKETALNKAYVKISEDLPLYEASLKPIIPKTKMSCLECLKDSYLFCESCSAPYCSEVCQKKHWPEHCLKCVSIPKLVQAQWHEYVVENLEIKLGDTVAIVGYDKETASVAIRLAQDDKNSEYLCFLDDCKIEAERSPKSTVLYKDTKVWALWNGHWYRGCVDKATGDKAIVELIDLSMKEEIPKSNLRLLQSKELFLRPGLTKTYRLKYVRQRDMLSSPVVKARMDQAILKQEKYTIKEMAYNFIDLQVDGHPQSFNNKLIHLYERQTGIADELLPEVEVQPVKEEVKETIIIKAEPTSHAPSTAPSSAPIYSIQNMTYPEYEPVMIKPQIFVIGAECDILGTWTIQGFYIKYKNEMQSMTSQNNSIGINIFKTTAPLKTFQDLELDQLCLYFDGKLYLRCAYKMNGNFEDIDIGTEYKDVKPDHVRKLPRDLVSKSYLMTMILDEDEVEDIRVMGEYLKTLKYQIVQSMDKVIHTMGNQFKVIWKKP